MAKKKKHPEHENLERWLVSYADFITLLFATFTALYAMSLTDTNKLKDIAAAISQGFEEQSLINGIKSILQGQSPPSKNPQTIPMSSGQGNGVLDKFRSMTYQPGDIEAMRTVTEKLVNDIAEINQEMKTMGVALHTGEGVGEDGGAAMQPVQASVQERGIRVSFDSRLLFPAGAATVRPSAYKFLDAVAARLKKFSETGHMLHIEGHTDDMPIATAMHPSNWELSGARASSVVRYFIGKHQYRPSTLVSVGYGDTQPVASNKTPEGRAKNRRVDIIIYTLSNSRLLSPRYQAVTEEKLNVNVQSEDPADKKPIPALPTVQDGPVRVIFKDKDGTDKVLIPKTNKLVPLKALEKPQADPAQPTVGPEAPDKTENSASH